MVGSDVEVLPTSYLLFLHHKISHLVAFYGDIAQCRMAWLLGHKYQGDQGLFSMNKHFAREFVGSMTVIDGLFRPMTIATHVSERYDVLSPAEEYTYARRKTLIPCYPSTYRFFS